MGLLGNILGMFGIGGGNAGGEVANNYMAPSIDELLGRLEQYMYQPQYTEQTEQGLYDLFNQLTGLGGGGVEAIPFDIGLPTTGLYDSLTRGIKEDYLGTPGGPEGGQIADMRAYYNNLGVPEQSINQERLGYRDMNNSLSDQAALINESQKDRLTNVLGLGSNVGTNLYSQNLAQHRSNAGLGLGAVGMGASLQDAIRQANQGSVSDLFGTFGDIGSLFGNFLQPSQIQQTTNTSQLGSLLGKNPNAPNEIYRGVPKLAGSMGSQTPSAYDKYTGVASLLSGG